MLRAVLERREGTRCENNIQARLIRARAITFMERRDEQYYDDEEEHAALMAEAVTDLEAVIR